jgi:hypothetical protein
MKRSSRPRRTASLSESIHHQLNMYALAASAAGVGALALAQPSEAKIVYTPAHRVIGVNSSYDLDLNHDGIADFIFSNTISCISGYCTYRLSLDGAVAANRVVGYYHGTQVFFSALKRGARIGPRAPFKRYFGSMVEVIRTARSHVVGPWANTKSRYLGVKFDIKGKTHYGWARFNVTVQKTKIVPVLTGYAFETIPGKAIIAGATKGPDDGEPTASFNTHTPEPATLAKLALGAPTLAIWRREESVIAASKPN